MPKDRAPTRIQKKNRAAILNAALEVFSAQGFRGATVDEIAASAGLSKPNLLYYFGSKEAIYMALLEGQPERGEGKDDPRPIVRGKVVSMPDRCCVPTTTPSSSIAAQTG